MWIRGEVIRAAAAEGLALASPQMAPLALGALVTVPRGTLPRLREVRRVLLTHSERRTLQKGIRTVVRREISAANSTLTTGKFGWCDLRNAHAKPYAPAMELRARSEAMTGRRTVGINSTIRVGDVIVSALPKAKKRDRFYTCYVVRKIECQRVRSVTLEQAMLEGYMAHHYIAAVGKLGAIRKARWRRSEQHREALVHPTAADVFAIDWVARRGFLSWRLNPWVWVYTLEIWGAPPATVVAYLDKERR